MNFCFNRDKNKEAEKKNSKNTFTEKKSSNLLAMEKKTEKSLREKKSRPKLAKKIGPSLAVVYPPVGDLGYISSCSQPNNDIPFKAHKYTVYKRTLI